MNDFGWLWSWFISLWILESFMVESFQFVVYLDYEHLTYICTAPLRDASGAEPWNKYLVWYLLYTRYAWYLDEYRCVQLNFNCEFLSNVCRWLKKLQPVGFQIVAHFWCNANITNNHRPPFSSSLPCITKQNPRQYHLTRIKLSWPWILQNLPTRSAQRRSPLEVLQCRANRNLCMIVSTKLAPSHQKPARKLPLFYKGISLWEKMKNHRPGQ